MTEVWVKKWMTTTLWCIIFAAQLLEASPPLPEEDSTSSQSRSQTHMLGEEFGPYITESLPLETLGKISLTAHQPPRVFLTLNPKRIFNLQCSSDSAASDIISYLLQRTKRLIAQGANLKARLAKMPAAHIAECGAVGSCLYELELELNRAEMSSPFPHAKFTIPGFAMGKDPLFDEEAQEKRYRSFQESFRHLIHSGKINNLGSLKIMSAGRAHSSKLGIGHVAWLPNLTQLTLHEVNFDDDSLGQILATCPKLKRLYLLNCAELSTNPVVPKKKMTHLAPSPQVQDQGQDDANLANGDFYHAASQSTSTSSTNNSALNLSHSPLRLIVASSCSGFSPRAYRLMAELRHLKGLVFSKCDISDDDLGHILSGCTTLSSLRLEQCTSLSANPFHHHQKNPQLDLHTLVLKSLKLNDGGLRTICQAFPHLTYLAIGQCPNLTNKSASFVSALLDLETLHLYAYIASPEIVAQFCRECPNLHELRVMVSAPIDSAVTSEYCFHEEVSLSKKDAEVFQSYKNILRQNNFYIAGVISMEPGGLVLKRNESSSDSCLTSGHNALALFLP
ncbi:MAG: hypothetical protein ACK5O7_04530 [Holosporales bacterium]